MDISSLLLKQIVIMFIYMVIGFVFAKLKYITSAGSKDIGKILLYLVTPIVILNNFWIEKSTENISNLVNATIISVIAMILSVLIAYFFFGKKDGISTFATAFSNAGFIGIPLVTSVLGEGAVFYISMMIVLINVLQWTFGVYNITNDKSVISIKKILSNPVVIAVFLGILIFVIELPKPEMVTTIFSAISSVNTPLAMIISGTYLASSDLLKMLKNKNIYLVSIVRLVIIPVIVMLVFKFLPFGSLDIKMAILITVACPTGSNVALFAQQYNKDYARAVELVCMTTIMCLLTIPIVMSIASSIL